MLAHHVDSKCPTAHWLVAHRRIACSYISELVLAPMNEITDTFQLRVYLWFAYNAAMIPFLAILNNKQRLCYVQLFYGKQSFQGKN